METPVITTAPLVPAPTGTGRAFPVRPWDDRPYSFVDWWEMEKFSADNLHAALVMIEGLRGFWANAQPIGDAAAAILLGQQRFLNGEEREDLQKRLSAISYWIRASGLLTSGEALNDLVEVVCDCRTQLSAPILAHDLEEFQKTIQREMRTVAFLYVPAEDARRYESPLDGWESVVSQWPQVKTNIAESIKCLALNRYGGAVFHILLVAEFGAIQVGRLLNVAGDRPGWGCVERLQKILGLKYPDRSPIEKQHSDLLRDVVPKLLALKAARHQITHADNSDAWIVQDIGPGTADEVIKATRWLMREIAARIQ